MWLLLSWWRAERWLTSFRLSLYSLLLRPLARLFHLLPWRRLRFGRLLPGGRSGHLRASVLLRTPGLLIAGWSIGAWPLRSYLSFFGCPLTGISRLGLPHIGLLRGAGCRLSLLRPFGLHFSCRPFCWLSCSSRVWHFSYSSAPLWIPNCRASTTHCFPRFSTGTIGAAVSYFTLCAGTCRSALWVAHHRTTSAPWTDLCATTCCTATGLHGTASFRYACATGRGSLRTRRWRIIPVAILKSLCK